MNCREFERGLDVLLGDGTDGDGPTAPEMGGLESHAAGCPSCCELLELALLPGVAAPAAAAELAELAEPAEPAQKTPGDFTAAVLSLTSGSACGQAEQRLPELVDGLLAPGQRELLAEHLEHCQACPELVRELERLAVDLPRLAIVRPQTSMVDAVLRRTLPLPVQLRRWWSAAWPRWVRRPRFASELAYVATLVLVVIFASPVSPLAAMPERALALTRSESLGKLEVLDSATHAELAARLQAAADAGAEHARSLATSTRRGLGTILDEVASWFENAEDEPSAETNQTTEETS